MNIPTLIVSRKSIPFFLFFIFFIFPARGFADFIESSDVLQSGFGVYSCFAGDPAETAVAVIDLNPAGALHDNPANHGPIDHSASFSKPREWSLAEFEGNQIMGLTFDSFTGEIYVATSGLYRDSGRIEGPDETKIYHISRDGNVISTVATLPGELGVGWLDMDSQNKVLYASNLDDGLIYSVNLAGGFNQTGPFQTFAPHAANALDSTLPPLGQRVLGVGYNSFEMRLYYAIWSEDQAPSSSAIKNTIRSIEVDALGNFVASTDVLEFVLPDNTNSDNNGGTGFNSPVSDIEFSHDGSIMLLAEQSFNSDLPRASAHNSNVIEYRGGATGSWIGEPLAKHRIGSGSSGLVDESNARGGVDFAFHDTIGGNVNGFEEFIIATGDALPLVGGMTSIYGFQFHPATGGDHTTAINVDLGSEASDIGNGIDKFLYGDIDVRLCPLVEIGNFIWIDANMDGIQDPGESPVAGVTVSLFDALGNFVGIAVTDVNGEYFFDVPPLQDFTVKLDNPADFAPGGPLDGFSLTSSDSGSDDALDSDAVDMGGFPAIMGEGPSIAEENDYTFDFGFIEEMTEVMIGDTVFIDNNMDGAQDAGDTPVAGVTVTLYDATGTTVIATTTTDPNGNYLFDASDGVVPGGSYQVIMDNPADFGPGGALEGFTPTIPNAGGVTDDLDSDATLVNGDPTIAATAPMAGSDLTYDFGFTPVPPPVSIGDTVFIDTNLDGIQDGGDLPVAGATVTLYDATGTMVIATTTTDANGIYMFTEADGVVPGGNYQIIMDNPADFLPGGPLENFGPTISDQGSDLLDSDGQPINGFPTIPAVTAPDAGSDLSFDFGFIELASLGNLAFEDTNSNGIQDPGEPGINGVVIMLFDAAGNMVTTDAFGNPLNLVTGPNPVDGTPGYYSLDNLVPGDYTVKFTAPTGLTLTNPNIGGDGADSDADPGTGLTQPITLVGGENNPTIDVGIIPAAIVDVVINVFDLAGVLIASEPGWVFPGEATELNLEGPPFNLKDNEYGLVEVVRTSGPSAAALANACFDAPQDNPLVVPWNGFLEQFNILTVRNNCAFAESATLELYDSEGTLRSSQALEFAAMSQLDVSLNAVEGYEANQVGTVKLSYENEGCVGGYLSRFKLDASGSGEYDFDLNLPLVNTSRGTTYASFNTFQPSLNPADAANPVYNWLEVINLSDSAQEFTKNIYDVSGNMVETEEVTIPSQARRDLQAGHENPGASMVGIVELIPANADAEYFARVMRYGSNPAVDGGFDFSTSSDASVGVAGCQYASVSAGAGGENWLVISNLSDSEASVNVELTSGGASLAGFPAVLNIPAKGQAHISASNELSGGAAGIATVCSVSGSSLNVESNFYFRDAEAGNVSSAYTKRSEEGVCGDTAVASYNTFLGLNNWLRLTGVGSGEIVGEIVRIDPESGLSSSSALQ